MLNLLLIVQTTLSIFLLVCILLPVIRRSFWVFRVFEYPRFQIWLMAAILLASWAFSIRYAQNFNIITACVLAAAFIYLSAKIWPYTVFAPKQMKAARALSPENRLRIFTANVLQDNRDYKRMLAQIAGTKPDIILLVETDSSWKAAMDVLQKDYPFQLGAPLGNTYGMLFYSKFEIVDGGVQYLVEKDVPSIEVTLLIPSGQPVKIFAVHPKPPVPGEADDSRSKDKEIMKVALKAEHLTGPLVVMGDFNDVAWSRVTKLFQKTANLLDPRRGRGFYSTFSAHSLFVRFPLDYIFCSPHFGLVSMKRLPKNGSDHFAVITELHFEPELSEEQGVEDTTPAESEEAVEKAKQPT